MRPKCHHCISKAGRAVPVWNTCCRGKETNRMGPCSEVLSTVTSSAGRQDPCAARSSLPGVLLTRTWCLWHHHCVRLCCFPFLGSSPGTHQCGVARRRSSRRGQTRGYLDGGGAALLVLALAEQAIGLHIVSRHRHRLHNVQTVAATQINQKEQWAQVKPMLRGGFCCVPAFPSGW